MAHAEETYTLTNITMETIPAIISIVLILWQFIIFIKQ